MPLKAVNNYKNMCSLLDYRVLTAWYGRLARLTVVMVCLQAGGLVFAQQPAPLPEPLTLDFALQQAHAMHPDVLAAQAELDQALAQQAQTEAEFGVNASVTGRLRYIEPSDTALIEQNDDNRVALEINKRLYDFGRHQAGLRASEEDITGRRLLLNSVIRLRRISIMQAYFNVILADLAYIRDNEDMATAFVSYDKVRDRSELGQVSDVDLLAAENRYQQARRKRYTSDIARQVARSRLALSMNRTGQLSSDLELPVLQHQKRKQPELEEMQKQAQDRNTVLRAMRRQLAAAEARLERAEAGGGPTIDAQLEAAEYSRETSGRDPFRVGLVFKYPLYTGGAVDAEIASERADTKRLHAELQAKQMAIHQQVLERWQDLYVLHARRDEANVLTDFRDLYLDRSRAQYELDLRTDLGDAMGRFSEARLEAARVRFELELAWERIDALIDAPVVTAQTPDNATRHEEKKSP